MSFGSRFLTSPELFPARIAGETWGREAISLDLPGGPYLIDGVTVGQRDAIRARYGDRAGLEGGGMAAALQVFRAPSSDFLEIDTRGWEYWLDYDAGEQAISIAGMRLMARIELSPSRAAIWTSGSDPEELWGIVENILRPFVALRLLQTGGLLVHSAAVALDGRGLLFAGPSGAGKSTIARLALANSHPVLSDDLNALVADGDGFRLLPMPFTGDLEPSDVARDSAPLQALLQLEKGDHESLLPLSIGEAVSLLVRSAPYVNQDRYRMPLLLERAAAVASAVPRGVLTFRRDADVWPILRLL
jgi:hypothetical protein